MTTLIVGLGNPGPKYFKTRHNVGFMILDYMAEQFRSAPFQDKSNCLYTKATYQEHTLYLVKPHTFMNLSGQALASFVHYFNIKPTQIIVIHDEIDLKFLDIRVKQGGGHGGHNGLRNLIEHIGAGFTRIRIGVGRPEIKGLEADYVLSDFSAHERAQISTQLPEITMKVLDTLSEQSPT